MNSWQTFTNLRGKGEKENKKVESIVAPVQTRQDMK